MIQQELQELINKYGKDAVEKALGLPVNIDNTKDIKAEAETIFNNCFGNTKDNERNLKWFKQNLVYKGKKAKAGFNKDCKGFVNCYMVESSICECVFKKWKRDIEWTETISVTCKLVTNHLVKNNIIVPYYKNNKKVLSNLVGYTIHPLVMMQFYITKDNDGLLYASRDVKPIYYILCKDKIIRRDTKEEMPLKAEYIKGLSQMNFITKVSFDTNEVNEQTM